MNASTHYTAELFYKGQDNCILWTLAASSAAQARSKFKELAYYRNMDLGRIERNGDYEVCEVI